MPTSCRRRTVGPYLSLAHASSGGNTEKYFFAFSSIYIQAGLMSPTNTTDPVLELENRTSAQFRGHTRLGTEITRGRADFREQIDHGPDRKLFINVPAVALFLRLQGHNQWPLGCLGLERAAIVWAGLH